MKNIKSSIVAITACVAMIIGVVGITATPAFASTTINQHGVPPGEWAFFGAPANKAPTCEIGVRYGTAYGHPFAQMQFSGWAGSCFAPTDLRGDLRFAERQQIYATPVCPDNFSASTLGLHVRPQHRHVPNQRLRRPERPFSVTGRANGQQR